MPTDAEVKEAILKLQAEFNNPEYIAGLADVLEQFSRQAKTRGQKGIALSVRITPEEWGIILEVIADREPYHMTTSEAVRFLIRFYKHTRLEQSRLAEERAKGARGWHQLSDFPEHIKGEYPYTQADYTPDIDAIANQEGAAREEAENKAQNQPDSTENDS